MLMKNLFFIAVMTLMGSLSAQSLPVDPVRFTSNPAAFNGKMVSISRILINPNNPTPAAPGVISVAPGASVSTGSGIPVAPGAPVVRCNAPRGFVPLDVDFPTDPTFQACFFISQAMFNTLPKGQDKIQSSLTFKGDYRIGYTVTLYKLGK
jgi:hypothetical protein